MEEHDEHHGHRTQPFDVGAEPAVPRGGSGLVGRAGHAGGPVDGINGVIPSAALLLFAGHRAQGVVSLLPGWGDGDTGGSWVRRLVNPRMA